MTQKEFDDSQFYCKNGEIVVKVGMILEGPGSTYYQVIHEASSDQVFLKQAGGSLLEPERGFLESCYPPLDPAQVPSF